MHGQSKNGEFKIVNELYLFDFLIFYKTYLKGQWVDGLGLYRVLPTRKAKNKIDGKLYAVKITKIKPNKDED